MVGFDGIPFTAISNPRLTTVVTPAGDMGRLAAASLIRAIREGTPPEGHVLEPELIVRESTRARPRAVTAVQSAPPSVQVGG